MKTIFLSILIPTYNRSQVLDKQLSFLVELLNIVDFKIIICNNSSDDNTDEIVKKWQKNCDNIIYFAQDENVGYDRNLRKCISLVDTDYFWILGDSTVIIDSEFREITQILKNDQPHGILVNAYGKIQSIDSKYYNNADEILYDLGWNISHLSSMILSREAFNTHAAERYFDTNFIHMGIFFEYIVTVKNLKVFFYHKNPFIHVSRFYPSAIRTSWGSKRYDIFCNDSFFLILSLPNQIKNETKLKCIKDHAKYNHFFSYERILRDRAKNYLDKTRFKKNERFFQFVSDTPVWYIKAVNLIPVNVFVLLRKLNKRSKLR